MSHDKPSEELTVETEREVDGRWIAEIPELPGVMAYGKPRDEAMANARALAQQVLAAGLKGSTSLNESHSAIQMVSPYIQSYVQ